jgi:hypothetical protein
MLRRLEGQARLCTQVHGFPKVMGVLTHLDQFTNTKQLKKTKKQLKAYLLHTTPPGCCCCCRCHWYC